MNFEAVSARLTLPRCQGVAGRMIPDRPIMIPIDPTPPEMLSPRRVQPGDEAQPFCAPCAPSEHQGNPFNNSPSPLNQFSLEATTILTPGAWGQRERRVSCVYVMSPALHVVAQALRRRRCKGARCAKGAGVLGVGGVVFLHFEAFGR